MQAMQAVSNEMCKCKSNTVGWLIVYNLNEPRSVCLLGTRMILKCHGVSISWELNVSLVTVQSAGILHENDDLILDKVGISSKITVI